MLCNYVPVPESGMCWHLRMTDCKSCLLVAGCRVVGRRDIVGLSCNGRGKMKDARLMGRVDGDRYSGFIL